MYTETILGALILKSYVVIEICSNLTQRTETLPNLLSKSVIL